MSERVKPLSDDELAGLDQSLRVNYDDGDDTEKYLRLIAELRAWRSAAAPFATLAERVDEWRSGSDTRFPAAITVGSLRRLRDLLPETQP